MVRTVIGFAGGALTLIVAAVLAVALPRIIDDRSDPLTVDVTANPDEITIAGEPVGGSYWFASPIGGVPAAPADANTCIGRYDWATGHSGVPAGSSTIRFTVTGLSETGVRLKSLTVHRLSSIEAPLGSVVACKGRGGNLNANTVTTDLDAPAPTAMMQDANGKPTSFNYEVAKGQSESFDVTAMAFRCDCTWEIDLTYEAHGRQGTYTVRNGQEPFRTVGTVNSKVFEWNNHAWTAYEPGLPQPAPGTVVDPCALLSPTDVSAVLGRRATPARMNFGSGSATDKPAASSLCTWTVSGPDAGSTPTTGGTSPAEITSLTVSVMELRTIEDAHAEYVVQAQKFQQAPGTSRTLAVADEAQMIGRTFLARVGQRLVTVYGQGLPAPEDVAEQAGTVAVRRVQ